MPAAIPIVAAVAGAVISGAMSKSAAKTQARAVDRGTEEQRRQYEQTREDQAPWRNAGMASLSQLTGGLQAGGEFNRPFSMADYQADPGYQFRLSEGQKGVETAAGARGSRYSGATLKALSRFNSDQASQEYGSAYNRYNNDISSRFNRLASVAGLGQTATNQVTAAGTNAANNISQGIADAGTARASGYVGVGNAVNQGIGQLSNYYQQRPMLSGLAGNNGSYYTPTQGGFTDLNTNATNQTANFDTYGANYSP